MRRCRKILWFVVGLFSQPLLADEPFIRHGAVVETHDGVRVEGGMTLTVQHGSDSQMRDDALASFDLVTLLPQQGGEWTLYLEGNTTPRGNGVASLLGETNADAGTALDGNGKGRVQVSGLYYTRPVAGNTLSLGLLDPAGILDASEVANDETSQFLGTGFVNNPTIAMPDHTLGSSFHVDAEAGRPGFSLLLSSSHGLADNPQASYAELTHIGADGKGLFLGGEMYWALKRSIWHMGAWVNSADFDYLDGSGNTAGNYGVYLSTDYALSSRSKVNLRAGLANEDVSAAADFLALALETEFAGNTAGMGVARTGVSRRAGPGHDDTYQAEIYWRMDINEQFQLSPSLQWIENSGFVKTDSTNSGAVFSLRLKYVFP